LAEQGECDPIDSYSPASNFFEPICNPSSKSSIHLNNGVSPLIYNSHGDLLPNQNCVSFGVVLIGCGFNAGQEFNCQPLSGHPGGEDEIMQLIGAEQNEIYKRILIADLMRFYMGEDNLLAAIQYLEDLNTIYAKKILVPTYIELKDYTQCGLRLSEIPSITTEDIEFHNLYDMLLSFCSQGMYIEEIGETERSVVEQVANSQTVIAAEAESILAQVDEIQYDRIPESIYGSKRSNINEVENELFDYRVYPNPAAKTFTIEIYSSDESKPFNEVSVELFDLIGTRVKHELIIQSKSIINIAELNNGIYMYTLRNGLQSKQGKIAIMK